MRPADQLAAFVRDALIAGKDRKAIAAAMEQAGWNPSEVDDALNAWSDADFTPPVPRPRPFVSARDAFFYGLMFIALAITAWHLCWLMFELIDRWLPDVGNGNRSYYSAETVRWSMSMLIVFFPLFFYLNNRAVKATLNDPAKRRSSVRRWFGFTTLFIAAITLLGDLVYVIFSLLNGDLTTRSLAKALVIAVVAGVIFLYFRKETSDGE